MIRSRPDGSRITSAPCAEQAAASRSGWSLAASTTAGPEALSSAVSGPSERIRPAAITTIRSAVWASSLSRWDEISTAGVGWYEVIHPSDATTHIAYVHEDGSIYLPEGPALDRHEFEFASARGKVRKLVRVDDLARILYCEPEPEAT